MKKNEIASAAYCLLPAYFKLFCLMFAVCGLFFLSSCSGEKSDQQMKRPPVPVLTTTVLKKEVPVQIHAIGNVVAYATVSIKARIGGELKGVYFTEGQYVNKGDKLFTIDPTPFETALDAAKANLARDAALAKKAEEDVARYTELFHEQLVSRSQYEQVFANAEALKATVEADKAALENARLQLSYCYISAPISGRTGNLLVDQGNLIKANDDKAMVVINQMQPVYVEFSVPEMYLSEIKKYMARGTLRVDAFISNDDEMPEKGMLTFVDNTVDILTGTIKLKGTFANRGNKLWPGQFVSLRITLSTIRNAVVVPTHAIQTGQQGQFVFVVKEDTAELRPVTASITHEEITVIEKGLAPGEVVVTDGQMRLMPGARVEIKKAGQQTGGKP